MTEPNPENKQHAANRADATLTNTQRIRFVRKTMIINGTRRHILEPTTSRDRTRVLPDSSQMLGSGYVPIKPSAGILCSARHQLNGLSNYFDQLAIDAAAYRSDAL